MGEFLWRLRRYGIEWQRILSAFCHENKRLALPRRVKRKRAGKGKPSLRFQSADLFFYFLYILSYLPESVFRMLHGAFYIGFLPPVIGEGDVAQLEFAVPDVESVGGKGAEGGLYGYVIEVQLFSSVVESTLYLFEGDQFVMTAAGGKGAFGDDLFRISVTADVAF